MTEVHRPHTWYYNFLSFREKNPEFLTLSRGYGLEDKSYGRQF